MLSILILSQRGEGYGLATRLAQEGHIVKFWRHDQQPTQATFNHERCRQVNRYEEHIESADLIIPAGRGFDSLGYGLRAQGKVVYGGGVSDSLELELISVLGDDFKPLTNLPTKLILGFWSNGWKWMARGVHINRMLEGGRGPKIKGFGYVLQAIEGFDDELVPLTDTGYTGWLTIEESSEGVVDVKLGIDNAVLGCVTELYAGNLGEAIYKLCVGEEVAPLQGYAGSVGLIDLIGLPPLELSDGAQRHFWNENLGTFKGSVTARGQNLREVRRRLNRTLSSLNLTNYIYRGDVADLSQWEEHHELFKSIPTETRASEAGTGTEFVTGLSTDN